MTDLLAAPELRHGYDYWCAKAAGRPYPDRRDIDPGELRRILPHLVIVEVVEGGLRYRLVGAALDEALGVSLTGRRVGEAVASSEHGRLLNDLYRRVVESGRALYAASAFFTPLPDGLDGTTPPRLACSVDRLLLPLSLGGPEVRQVLGVLVIRRRLRHATMREILADAPLRHDRSAFLDGA